LFVNSFFINALAQNVPAIEKTVRSSIWWNLSDQNARPFFAGGKTFHINGNSYATKHIFLWIRKRASSRRLGVSDTGPVQQLGSRAVQPPIFPVQKNFR
jgi:hypothetical protein